MGTRGFSLSIAMAAAFVFSVASPSLRSQKTPGLESVFPKGFDPRHQYRPYDYDGLAAYLKLSFGITNTFAGEKVKVIALYDSGNVFLSVRPNELNRSKQVLPRNGCMSEFCDRLEKLYGEASTKVLFEDVPIYVHFNSKEAYGEFVQTSAVCTKLKPCYMLVSGTLQVTNVAFRRGLFSLHKDIAYLNADRLLLLKAPDGTGLKLEGGAIAYGATSGWKIGKQIFSAISP